MKPTRGLCYVKKVETAETMPGGLVLLPESARDALTACQVEVVAVGPDALCEDFEECERPHEEGRDHRGRACGFHNAPKELRAGAWAVVAHRSLFDVGEDAFWGVHQDDVLAVLEP